MPTLDNHASSLYTKIVLPFSLLLMSCGYENQWTLRECITTRGESFIYRQYSREPLAEDHKTIVNRYGVRDTQGWWRDEDTIYSCRDKN